MHRGVCGGNQHWKATMLNILRETYYWPTLFYDVFSTVRACNECHIFTEETKVTITASETYPSQQSVSTMGIRIHRRNKSTL
jgi:hypothetical protein